MKKILGYIKRAQNEFHMIKQGDVVAVGLSGGKDSMTLLYALHLFQHFSPVSYTLKAITLDLGFPGFDSAAISQYCQTLGVELLLEKTQISSVVFQQRKESNPCSLCARMRRGRLNKICDSNGITKLALGHHGDDLVESLLMSMLFEGRMSSFQPVTRYERASVIMIRPMIFAPELEVSQAALRHHIPRIGNPCPADGHTKRESIKKWISALDCQTPNARSHMIEAILRENPKKETSL